MAYAKEKKSKIKKSEAGNEIEEFITDARKKLDRAVDADRHNRKEAVDCLNFALGGTAQWDDLEVQRRKRRRRLILSLNQCPKYIKRLTGEMRQNRAIVKVYPSDSAATNQIALIRQGMINNIFYQSDFETILDDAAKQLVTCGYGAWRVCTRYDDANPFQQEIYLEYIENPLMVYMDPTSKDPLYRDAKYGFIMEKKSKEDFEEEYPNAQLPGEDLRGSMAPGGAYEHWYDTNGAVTIAEMYKIVFKKTELALMNNGEVLSKEEAEDRISEWKKKWSKLSPGAAVETPSVMPPMPGPTLSPSAAVPPSMPPLSGLGMEKAPEQGGPESAGMSPIAALLGGGAPPMPPVPPVPPVIAPPKPVIVDTKSCDVPEIRYWKLTGLEILEGEKEGLLVPGKMIPIVMVRGERLNVEGKVHIKGLVNDARDPQRLLNFWETNAAENVAMSPKAPWVATPKQLKGFEKFYAQAHEENYPFLTYNVDPETPNTKPSREAPPAPPMSIFAQIDRSERYIQNAMGMFGADTGDMDALSGRASGTAIGARRAPSEASVFVYQDNLNKAIMHTGRIAESMLPEVYDTDRDVALRGIDGVNSFIPINTTIRKALTKVSKNPERYPEIDRKNLQEELVKVGDGNSKYNDLTKGKYETVIKVGPDYATQKDESAKTLIALTQANPQQMSLVMDLILKNLPILDSDEAAERLEKTLPPGMLRPKPGKPAPPPPPPNPRVEISKAKMEVEKKKVEVQMARLQVEKIKALKELQGEKGEMKKALLELLKEVYSGGEKE